MKKQKLTDCLLYCGAILIFSASVVRAQDGNDTAIRREFVEAGSQVILIEMTSNATVRDDERMTATVYRQEQRGNIIFAQDMQVHRCSPDDTGLPEPNSFCFEAPEVGKIQLLYRFSATPPAKDAFLISFSTIKVDVSGPSDKPIITQRTTSGSVAQVAPESPKGKVTTAVIPVDKTFQKRSKATVNCVDSSEYVFTKDGAVEMNLKTNVIRIQFELPDDAPTLQRRVNTLLSWLDSQKGNPPGIAEVKIEKRNEREGALIYPLAAFTYQVQCRQQLIVDQGMSIFLIGEDSFPADAFDFQIKFNNPPIELAKTFKGSSPGLGSVKTPTADTVGTDKTLGLRSFESNLNLGLAFTSSVSDVKQGNSTVRKRQNASALDLRFAPWLNLNLSPPRRRQYLITPIFFDAKVASGKITEKTLALNRILIGSEFDIKFIRSTKANRSDKYLLRFQFVNASDRDFKRVEEKFTFETDFMFAKLNRPLSEQFNLVDGEINPDAGFKVVPTKWFGYQIQPVIGLELGKTIRRKRDVFSIENESNFVRRLYFGGDMKFNLTRHFNVTLSDTFYLRGETASDRGRNHFKGIFETPLGSISQNSAQSIFFSFERGDEPPFNSPSVNALKLGYRIITNLGLNGRIR